MSVAPMSSPRLQTPPSRRLLPPTMAAVIVPALAVPAIAVAAEPADATIATAAAATATVAAAVAAAATAAAAAAAAVAAAAADALHLRPERSERSSSISSADWDGLSAILGGESEADEAEAEAVAADEVVVEKQEGEKLLGGASGRRGAQVEVRHHLSHREFAAHFRHKRPVLLRGFANDWPAVSAWLDVEHLRGLLPGKSVTVLRAGDGRRFLKRDCTQEQWPFSQVGALQNLGESRRTSANVCESPPGRRPALCRRGLLEGVACCSGFAAPSRQAVRARTTPQRATQRGFAARLAEIGRASST